MNINLLFLLVASYVAGITGSVLAGENGESHALPWYAEQRADGKVCVKPLPQAGTHPSTFSQPLLFSFEGQQYQADAEVKNCRRHALHLPDGRYILPHTWLQSMPPQINWKHAEIVNELPVDWWAVDAHVWR